MIFSRDYIGYLARRTVKHLVDAKLITTSDMKVTEERVNAALLEELSLEDRINDEVRVILEAYSDEMRKSGAQYQEMFKKVKNRARAQIQGGAMRISRRQAQQARPHRRRHSCRDRPGRLPRRPQHHPPGSPQGPRDTSSPKKLESTPPPASKSPISARSSSKAPRSGRSSTASTTTTKCANSASDPQPHSVSHSLPHGGQWKTSAPCPPSSSRQEKPAASNMARS